MLLYSLPWLKEIPSIQSENNQNFVLTKGIRRYGILTVLKGVNVSISLPVPLRKGEMACMIGTSSERKGVSSSWNRSPCLCGIGNPLPWSRRLGSSSDNPYEGGVRELVAEDRRDSVYNPILPWLQVPLDTSSVGQPTFPWDAIHHSSRSADNEYCGDTICLG